MTPALGEIVHCDGDRKGDGAFIGIVSSRYRSHCHVIVGALITHWGQYGVTYEDVEYGVRYDDPSVSFTGTVLRPTNPGRSSWVAS